MTETSVHKLLCNLTTVLKADVARRAMKGPLREEDSKELRPCTTSVPQVVIYTRQCEGDYATTFVSENVMAQFGYTQSDFTSDPAFWPEHIHPDDETQVAEGLEALTDKGRVVLEYRFRNSKGEYRWTRDELNLLRDDNGASVEILGSLMDVTDLDRSERALRKSEARYRSLVESSPVGMVSFDVKGEITEFNPAVLSILGVPSIKASTPLDLFSLFPMAEAGISEAIFQCLESGEPTIGEFEYKGKQNRLVCTRLHVVPIRDGEGRITGAHAFVQDISDQKRAEELIIRSERLKVLGQISGGVGHAFSNLLQIVSGNTNMALTNLDLREYERIRVNLEQILESARSATETVRWLQQFARERPHRSVVTKEVFEFSEVVREAIEVCKLWSKVDLERKKIQIHYESDLEQGCWVEGVPDQIGWMVLNVLKNAVEALPRGGRIKVTTNVRNQKVILKVQDNGIGIRAQDINQITVAFWTNKEAHAGIGLAFGCGIIRQHGGAMGVKRMKPHGTTFTVRLPWIKDPSEKRKALAQEASERGFRILIIDDDEPVLEIFETGLSSLGQSVLCARSGELGLKLLQEMEFDAIVCDLAMDGMKGWEVALSVAEISGQRGVLKPPFILLTGWAGQLSQEEILAHPEVDRIVQKPINVPDLLDAIAEEISRTSVTAAFSGRVEGVDLLEYVQLMILTGRPVVVEVLLKSGAQGLIYLDKGRFLHATCGDLEGEEAVYRCVNFAGGSFSNLPWTPPDRITIDKPGEFVILEAARRRDDSRSESQAARESGRLRITQEIETDS